MSVCTEHALFCHWPEPGLPCALVSLVCVLGVLTSVLLLVTQQCPSLGGQVMASPLLFISCCVQCKVLSFQRCSKHP